MIFGRSSKAGFLSPPIISSSTEHCPCTSALVCPVFSEFVIAGSVKLASSAAKTASHPREKKKENGREGRKHTNKSGFERAIADDRRGRRPEDKVGVRSDGHTRREQESESGLCRGTGW